MLSAPVQQRPTLASYFAPTGLSYHHLMPVEQAYGYAATGGNDKGSSGSGNSGSSSSSSSSSSGGGGARDVAETTVSGGLMQRWPPLYPPGRGFYGSTLSARLREIYACSDSEDERVDVKAPRVTLSRPATDQPPPSSSSSSSSSPRAAAAPPPKHVTVC